MLKKLFWGALLVGLIGVLVFGAVNRTLSKAGNASEGEQGNGHGKTKTTLANYEANQGREGNGYGREAASNAQAGVGQAQVNEWVTKQGAVVSVNEEQAVVQLADEELIVEGRGWRFAQEQGFALQSGDQVTLVGFDEGDRFEIGQIDNLTSGQTLFLRDTNGRPMWAGRGRGGS